MTTEETVGTTTAETLAETATDTEVDTETETEAETIENTQTETPPIDEKSDFIPGIGELSLGIKRDGPAEVEWTGKWIWDADNVTGHNWVCFRKTVTLDTVPQNAVTRIAIDSHYWLSMEIARICSSVISAATLVTIW